MPRILRIVNRFNLGGPSYNAAYLTRYLPPEYETILIGGKCGEHEDTSEFILKDLGINAKVIPEMLRAIHPVNDWRAFRSIRRIIRDFRPDIVHTHAAKAGTLGRLAAIAERVPVIVHTFHGHVFHSYFPEWKTAIYRQIERYLARRSSAAIAISKKQREELTLRYRICAIEKITVIPLGFDLERFRVQPEEKRKLFRNYYGIGEDEFAIGIIGRIVPVKNHALFIKVLKYLIDHNRCNIRAFVIGDGEEKQKMIALAEKYGIMNTEMKWAGPARDVSGYPLIFTSWIREIENVYAGLDAVALTSLNEGTPVSLIEAQATGRPLVSTDVGGVADALAPMSWAMLSQPNDAVAMGNHIIALMEDRQLYNRMAEAGRQFVNERFTIERLVRDMDGLYRKLKS